MTGDAPDPTLVDVPDGQPVDDPGFVARRSVMPAGNAWGGTAAQHAHLSGVCDPSSCPHCADAAALRGDIL